ncbi:hypothetical protein D3C77_703210 [compost metagenome]
MLKARGVVANCEALEQACLGAATDVQLQALLDTLEQSLLTLEKQLAQSAPV